MTGEATADERAERAPLRRGVVTFFVVGIRCLLILIALGFYAYAAPDAIRVKYLDLEFLLVSAGAFVLALPTMVFRRFSAWRIFAIGFTLIGLWTAQFAVFEWLAGDPERAPAGLLMFGGSLLGAAVLSVSRSGSWKLLAVVAVVTLLPGSGYLLEEKWRVRNGGETIVEWDAPEFSAYKLHHPEAELAIFTSPMEHDGWVSRLFKLQVDGSIIRSKVPLGPAEGGPAINQDHEGNIFITTLKRGTPVVRLQVKPDGEVLPAPRQFRHPQAYPVSQVIPKDLADRYCLGYVAGNTQQGVLTRLVVHAIATGEEQYFPNLNVSQHTYWGNDFIADVGNKMHWRIDLTTMELTSGTLKLDIPGTSFWQSGAYGMRHLSCEFEGAGQHYIFYTESGDLRKLPAHSKDLAILQSGFINPDSLWCLLESLDGEREMHIIRNFENVQRLEFAPDCTGWFFSSDGTRVVWRLGGRWASKRTAPEDATSSMHWIDEDLRTGKRRRVWSASGQGINSILTTLSKDGQALYILEPMYRGEHSNVLLPDVVGGRLRRISLGTPDGEDG